MQRLQQWQTTDSKWALLLLPSQRKILLEDPQMTRDKGLIKTLMDIRSDKESCLFAKSFAVRKGEERFKPTCVGIQPLDMM